MKGNRGHLPELADPVAKVERCRACGMRRQRGNPWPGPCDPLDRRPTPVSVDPRAVHVVPEGRYFGRTKDGG